MPTNHDAIAAIPESGNTDKEGLRTLLFNRMIYALGDDENPQDLVAVDPLWGGAILGIVFRGRLYWYDPDDGTTVHDGVTCLVTQGARRYKLDDLRVPISVLDKDLTTPPVSPSIGDAYFVLGAPAVGDWEDLQGHAVVYTARGWEGVIPAVGMIFFVVDEEGYYHIDADGDFVAGFGATPLSAASVPLSAIIGTAASLIIRVENQTTYAPPGSRKTGATPAMPLGGTAANINDNSDASTSTTSALGNLTGAVVASRIFAKLSLAAPTDLICIEARGLLGSAVSSATAMGLYYSIDSGSNWTQAGAGFTLSTSAQNIQRAGSFAGVTDIAVVTEAKNWASNTHTIAGLNGFDATITASVGDAYIIAANAFGVFAGHAGKVVVCEIVNTFTIYTPAAGDEVYDKARAIDFKWNGTTWESASGAIIAAPTPLRASGQITTRTGSGFYTYSDSVAPTISQTAARETLIPNHAAKRAAASADDYNVSINYQATLTVTDGGSGDRVFTAALFIDNQLNAVDWGYIVFGVSITLHINMTFEVAAPDTAAHDYKVVVMDASSISFVNALSRRSVALQERA